MLPRLPSLTRIMVFPLCLMTFPVNVMARLYEIGHLFNLDSTIVILVADYYDPSIMKYFAENRGLSIAEFRPLYFELGR